MEFPPYLKVLLPALRGEHISEKHTQKQTNSNIVNSLNFNESRARTKFSRRSLAGFMFYSIGAGLIKLATHKVWAFHFGGDRNYAYTQL